MARPVYQYQPINETPDVAVGILLPMNKSSDAFNDSLTALSGSVINKGQQYDAGTYGGSSVFAQSYTTEDQAISNLKNLLLTMKGERIMQPDFGTRIRESVFQQSTSALSEFLIETISADINRWLPYIKLNGINVDRDIESYNINIQIQFQVGTTGANLVINLLANENEITIINLAPDTLNQSLIQVGSFGV